MKRLDKFTESLLNESVKMKESRGTTRRNRRLLRNVDPFTTGNNETDWPPTTPLRTTAAGGTALTATPTHWEMTTPGLGTPPQPARTPARCVPNPSPFTEFEDGGGNDITEVISISELEDVTVTVPTGEETPKPRCGERFRRKPSYLKDYVED